MLDHDVWLSSEPRLNFPIFGGLENHIDITIQEPSAITGRKLAAPLYHFFKKRKGWSGTLRDYWLLVFNPPYRFKGVFVDRQGHQRAAGDFPGAFRSGDFFHCNVNQWLGKLGVPMADGNFILIANRGRPDLFSSSPGNVTLRVVGPRHVAGFRTGFFCRALNEGHKHFGFTGLNPQVEVRADAVAGLLLINHSSAPSYDKTVSPQVRLHRAADDFLEASFGDIAPHAALERSIPELFPGAAEFLAGSGGRGYSITTVRGASLASIHVLRTPDGELLSLDHSRPAHPNIVDYL